MIRRLTWQNRGMFKQTNKVCALKFYIMTVKFKIYIICVLCMGYFYALSPLYPLMLQVILEVSLAIILFYMTKSCIIRWTHLILSVEYVICVKTTQLYDICSKKNNTVNYVTLFLLLSLKKNFLKSFCWFKNQLFC